MATLMEEPGSSERERVDALARFIEDECAKRLAAYSAQPRDTHEHYETEIEVLSGGYAYRQLFELVQNAADAVLEGGEGVGRIHVRLERDRLVAANTGAALDADGVVALLNARSSPKRAGQIGRFGIGFKSLLKLGGTVDLISRSIGMRFDPQWCRTRIRAHLGLAPDADAPGMRLAQVLDPGGDDSPLNDNEFSWATTVVLAEIREPKDRQRLVEEVAAFPAEFVLFLSSDVELVLEVVEGTTRTISRRREGEIILVEDGSSQSRWRLFEREIEVDDAEARADALHLQARDKVPLAWAAPLANREAAGSFWAFFPTQTPTLASGILNAPWKLNSDRTHIIRGAYNSFLMKAAADLMAEHIGQLATSEDPGAPISALPRKLDRQDDVAAPLVTALWDKLVERSFIANAEASLCRATDLWRHPLDDQKALGRWTEIADEVAKKRFVHPTCQAGKLRNGRLEALIREAADRLGSQSAALPMVDEAGWIEAIATPSLPTGADAILFVGELIEQEHFKRYDVAKANFIPALKDELVSPEDAIIAPPERAPTGKFSVLPALLDVPGVRRTLVDQLDVKEMDDELWAEVLLNAWKAANKGAIGGWDLFWANVAEAPIAHARSFLEEGKPVLFRSQSGNFEKRCDLVVPSTKFDELLPPSILLDRSYHQPHWDRLPERLTATLVVEPHRAELNWEGVGWDKIKPYFDQVKSKGWSRISSKGAQWGKCGILSQDYIHMPGGWRLLPYVSSDMAALLTMPLIAQMQGVGSDFEYDDDDEEIETPAAYDAISYGHTTRRDAYPDFSAPHPFLFLLHHFGWCTVAGEPVPLSALTAALMDAIAVLGIDLKESLASYFLSREDATDLQFEWATTKLGADQAVNLWEVLFERAQATKDDFSALNALWECAAQDGQVPALVPTADGPLPINQIFVSDAPLSSLRVDDGKAVHLSEAAAALWQQAGANWLSDHVELIYEALGEPLRLSGLFPELKPVLKTRLAKRLDALWVRGLKERSGPHVHEPALAYDHAGLILIERQQLEDESWTARTRRLLEFLHANQLIEDDPDAAIAQLLSQRVVEARARVRAGETLEQRLLLAVGGSRKALLLQLTEATRQAIPRGLSDEDLAALSLAVHGPTLLSRLKDVLESEGLAPPGRWGGEAAHTFVMELGFPAEFAASAQIRRNAEWIVNGPIHLPPLHDYQEDILAELEALFDSGSGRRRAVVSLPTGGGKTRVAAEAIVRLILNGEGKRTVLWVAQTDELCEQAVQCFRQLWVNVGAPEEDLRIVRLWGGQSNPAPPEANEPVVVVASIQTLNARLDVEQLGWLAQPGVLVIDECHHAIAPSYSALLRWLDVQTGTESEREEEPPVIGLSATPWRGYDEDESRRLAARFDQRWLPKDQDQLHQDLLEREVLAKLTYHPIQYDKIVELSEAEIRHLDQYKELPDSFVERIGEDPDRNEKIIESVLGSRSSSILLFANAVKHAQYLAARLHLAGCPAAAVSGETDRLARQHFIRRFKSGELKVLCNHSVLTTGFDAPKADMILISRPVFSPVRYMQMVGRGLRGPKNGGTEKCNIVTVEDNILNYRDRLAYHFCRRFFEV